MMRVRPEERRDQVLEGLLLVGPLKGFNVWGGE